MSGLFDGGAELERLPLPDADVQMLRRLPLQASDALILRRLIDETDWCQENVVVWGKSHPQPRLIAWHGDAGKSYSYSGIAMNPVPWTPLLEELRGVVEPLTGERFNSVLLNYYRDARDSMGYHSDDERELGPEPTIASVSFGEVRDFVFKHKSKTMKPVRVPLPSGSLLLMKGPTQANWKHGIEKSTRPMGPRVNLTFRRILG
jgi:alkylated DNA repair dioxygenase AlkB